MMMWQMIAVKPQVCFYMYDSSILRLISLLYVWLLIFFVTILFKRDGITEEIIFLLHHGVGHIYHKLTGAKPFPLFI